MGLLRSILLLSLLAGVARNSRAQTAPQPPTAATKRGILIELFTSEGCSSCPPADALLRKLDSDVVLPDAQLVVIGEHVDYWDRTGWRDRFSSHDYTERQTEYARRFRIPDPYTPQMVVDGNRELLGNNGRLLEAAIKEAVSQAKAPVAIVSATQDGNQLMVNIETGPLPSGSKHADLYIAVADNLDETQVGGGENSGKKLQHVAVARSLQKVAKVGPEGLQKEAKIRLGKSENSSNLRVIAFLQESGQGKVLGSSVKTLNSLSATR
jgi:hypothetical protein